VNDLKRPVLYFRRIRAKSQPDQCNASPSVSQSSAVAGRFTTFLGLTLLVSGLDGMSPQQIGAAAHAQSRVREKRQSTSELTLTSDFDDECDEVHRTTWRGVARNSDALSRRSLLLLRDVIVT